MYIKFKRFLDIILALLIIVPYSILHTIISIMILTDSKGGVLFKQNRVGYRGKKFKIYKYRTMVENAENMGTGIYTGYGDPRITKSGKMLRQTSMDELPQLFNIIKGDMSFIGPRPPLVNHPYKWQEYTEYQKKRFAVRPGITGLAQTTGRNKLTWDERIDYDVEYVENMSIRLDCKIILKTVFNLILSKDIYSRK